MPLGMSAMLQVALAPTPAVDKRPLRLAWGLFGTARPWLRPGLTHSLGAVKCSLRAETFVAALSTWSMSPRYFSKECSLLLLYPRKVHAYSIKNDMVVFIKHIYDSQHICVHIVIL